MSSHRNPERLVLMLPVAFAVGCLPTARLVVRLFDRGRTVVLDGAGASAVHRSLGTGPAIVCGVVDFLKGYTIARIARHGGAGRNLTGALAVAPMIAHVVVLGGRGVSTGTGAAFAIDELSTILSAVPVVAGSVAGHHAFSVALGALSYPVARWLVDRSHWAPLWGLVIVGVGTYARLRGDARIVPTDLTRELAWNRFWYDNDQPRHAPLV